MDFSGRAEWEATIAGNLAKLGERQRRDIMRLLGDPPQLDRISPDYWREHEKELLNVIDDLEQVYVQSAADFIASQPAFGVDWNLINRDAANWSRGYWYAGGTPDPMYPGALAARFTAQRQRQLGDAVARYFEDGWTIGKLRDRLSEVFGPVWSELVASTEVTRAAVQGERAVVAELNAQGIQMTEIWQTNNDELVCPICGPRHGKQLGDGWTHYDGPPAHPRCRCWIGHELRPQQ